MKSKSLMLSFLFSVLILPIVLMSGACSDDKVELNDEMLSFEESHTFVYDGLEKTPTVVVKIGEDVVPQQEYRVTYQNNINAGEATAIVTASSDAKTIKGTAQIVFEIEKLDLSSQSVNAQIEAQEFCGEEITPSIMLRVGETLLPSFEYELAFSNNINVGEATVVISAKDSATNLVGSKSFGFEITKANLTNTTVSINGGQDVIYNGTAQEPEVEVTLGNTVISSDEYEINYGSFTDAGQAQVVITAKQNAEHITGTVTKTYVISPKALTDEVVVLNENSFEYDGTIKQPTIVAAGDMTATDYVVSYYRGQSVTDDFISAGEIRVVLTARGNYCGTIETTYTIAPKDANAATVQVYDVVYDGTSKQPGVVVTLGSALSSANYDLVYANNIDARDSSDGNAPQVTITFKGNYTGQIVKKFTILPENIANISSSALVRIHTYTGEEIKPEFTLRAFNDSKVLVQGIDYEQNIVYANNINVGTATITVTGKGNFSGTKTLEFEIVQAMIRTQNVILSNAIEWTNAEIKPVPQVTVDGRQLVLDEDFTLEYAEGNYTDVTSDFLAITVTGINNYSGAVTTGFRIVPRSITNTSVTVQPIENQTYTGQPITPAVTITDSVTGQTLAINDYDLEYMNNTNVGTASIIVTGKGNYTGTKVVEFTISAKALTEQMISWAQNATYNNQPQNPAPTVQDGNYLTQNDYRVAYYSDYGNKVLASNFTNAQTIVVEVVGQGNYTGAITHNFVIQPKDVEGQNAGLSITNPANVVYNGQASTNGDNTTVFDGQLQQGLTLGVDYDVSYSGDHTNAGTVSVVLTFKGNYTGTINTVTYQILPITLTIEPNTTSFIYNGTEQKPIIGVYDNMQNVITASAETYQITYPANSTNAGQKQATIAYGQNYTGNATVDYEITKAQTNNLTVSMADYAFGETPSTPVATATFGTPTYLYATDDGNENPSSLNYSSNAPTAVGNYYVKATILETNDYVGAVAYGKFAVTATAITANDITLSQNAFVFNNQSQTPTVTVQVGGNVLDAQDFTVIYKRNGVMMNNTTDVGTIEVCVQGNPSRGYSGTASKTYTITPANITVELNESLDSYIGNVNYTQITTNGVNNVTKNATELLSNQQIIVAYGTTLEMQKYVGSQINNLGTVSVVGLTTKEQVEKSAGFANSIQLASNINDEINLLAYLTTTRRVVVDLHGYSTKGIKLQVPASALVAQNFAPDIEIISSESVATINPDYTNDVGLNIFAGKNIEASPTWHSTALTLNIQNVRFNGGVYGLKTNVYGDGRDSEGYPVFVSMFECEINAPIQTSNIVDGIDYGYTAAYLAGFINAEFNRCTFNGGTGMYAKSGVITLESCTLYAKMGGVATPSWKYDANECYGTMSALVVDSCDGNNVKVLGISARNTVFESEQINAIESYSTRQNSANPALNYATVHIEDCYINSSMYSENGVALSQTYSDFFATYAEIYDFALTGYEQDVRQRFNGYGNDEDVPLVMQSNYVYSLEFMSGFDEVNDPNHENPIKVYAKLYKGSVVPANLIYDNNNLANGEKELNRAHLWFDQAGQYVLVLEKGDHIKQIKFDVTGTFDNLFSLQYNNTTHTQIFDYYNGTGTVEVYYLGNLEDTISDYPAMFSGDTDIVIKNNVARKYAVQMIGVRQGNNYYALNGSLEFTVDTHTYKLVEVVDVAYTRYKVVEGTTEYGYVNDSRFTIGQVEYTLEFRIAQDSNVYYDTTNAQFTFNQKTYEVMFNGTHGYIMISNGENSFNFEQQGGTTVCALEEDEMEYIFTGYLGADSTINVNDIVTFTNVSGMGTTELFSDSALTQSVTVTDGACTLTVKQIGSDLGVEMFVPVDGLAYAKLVFLFKNNPSA